MTQKDYIILARAIRNARLDLNASGTGVQDYEDGAADAFTEITKKLMYELSADNPRFSAEKFRAASGGNDKS